MIAARVTWNEVPRSTIVPEVIASGSASDQTKKGGSRRFVVSPKGDEWARLAVRDGRTTGNANSRLLFECLGQQIDVLKEPSRAKRNRDMTVEYRRQLDGPTLLVSCSCGDEGERVAIAVDSVGDRWLRSLLNQICQGLLNVPKRAVRVQVGTAISSSEALGMSMRVPERVTPMS